MKYTLTIIAFFIFLKPVFPFLEYAFNYDYIAKVLCVNKDKPKLKCNGKCYLMQQLAKNAAEESPTKEKLPKKVEFQLVYFHEVKPINFNYQAFTDKKQKIGFVFKAYNRSHKETLFRPPILLV